MNNRKKPACVLTVAGTDSSGGAGVQADLKTFGALGCYGISAVTALTAQNTLRVDGIFGVDADFVQLQMETVLDDIKISALKTGMLPSAQIVEKVADTINRYKLKNVVVDPVIVTTNGDQLIPDEAVKAIKSVLLPLATVVTPNVHEAQILGGSEINNLSDLKSAANAIRQYGSSFVLVKGGHLNGDDSIDVLYDGKRFHEYSARRITTNNTHGTGCTLASAIAAYLAQGKSVPIAVKHAKAYVSGAMSSGFDIGRGAGPLDHFHQLIPQEN